MSQKKAKQSGSEEKVRALTKENEALKKALANQMQTIQNQTLLIGEQALANRQLVEQLKNAGAGTVPNGPKVG